MEAKQQMSEVVNVPFLSNYVFANIFLPYPPCFFRIPPQYLMQTMPSHYFM